MAAYRLFDVFNAKIGTTQVVGAEGFSAWEGYRPLENQGGDSFGAEYVEKGPHFVDAVLECQEISGFGTLVGLFEQNDTLPVMAEGKVAGSAVAAGRLEVQRCKLGAASLSFKRGQHARARLELLNSASPTSNAPEQEISLTAPITKVLTYAGRYRGVEIVSVTYTPYTAEPEPVSLSGVDGLELALRWKIERRHSDGEFGETCETSELAISGRLLLQDLSLLEIEDHVFVTAAQNLIGLGWGELQIEYRQQGGQPNKILTLEPLNFMEGGQDLRSGKFHDGAVPFRMFLPQQPLSADHVGKWRFGVSDPENGIFAAYYVADA